MDLDKTLREENLLFIRNKFIELESRLAAQIEKENDIINKLSENYEDVSRRLEQVYSIINVHNNHYSEMSAQMASLIESNKRMTDFLATLEKLHYMLDIATAAARKNGH